MVHNKRCIIALSFTKNQVKDAEYNLMSQHILDYLKLLEWPTSLIALSRSGFGGAVGGMQRWPHSLRAVMKVLAAVCSSLLRLSLWS